MNRLPKVLVAAVAVGSVALVSGCSGAGEPVSFDGPAAPAPAASGGKGLGG